MPRRNSAKAKIKLLVEPINTRDIPGFYPQPHRSGASRLIDEVGSDNLFVQYDIYHMQIMEGDLARTIEANLPRIAHVQLADNPGRNEPGTGEINYPFLFRHLDRIGYAGWIGCEYKPLTNDGRRPRLDQALSIVTSLAGVPRHEQDRFHRPWRHGRADGGASHRRRP